MDLVDVVRGTVVWKMPRVVSSQVERAKANPLNSNPLDDALQELAQFLEAECIFRPLPEQLKARHALSSRDGPFDQRRTRAVAVRWRKCGSITSSA